MTGTARGALVLLGVDAGASHSSVVVGGEDAVVRGRAEGPPAAMRPGEAATAAAAIAHTARQAAQAAGVALPADRAVVGAAGAGRPEEQAELAEALRATRLALKIRVLPDGEVALEGALPGPGILLNAGTGSVAFARDAEATVHRAGGYGWQVGDEAGGYWLGRRALEAAARAQDGRGEGSTLGARLLAALSLRRFDDLIRWATTATPAQVAALAPHVLNAARDGEVVAQRAVEDAARELASLVSALERWFPGEDPIPVALAGGLLGPDSPLTRALRTELQALPRARVAERRIDPAVAALKLAARTP